MVSPQQKYYNEHREDILVKMREREKTRRIARQQTYGDTPENQEIDRAKMRAKYRSRVANDNKKTILAFIDHAETPADVREFLRGVLMREEYKNYTRKTLDTLLSSSTQMPRVKKVPAPAGPDTSLVPAELDVPQSVTIPTIADLPKPKKERKQKPKDVTVLDATEVTFKVEKGPIRISFA